MKVCSKCKVEKDESEFYFRSDSKRLTGQCKECYKSKSSNWQKNNRGKATAKAMAWKKKHKERVIQYREKEKENYKQRYFSDKEFREKRRLQFREANKRSKSWTKEKNKKRVRDFMNKEVEELGEAYIKAKLRRSGIPTEVADQYPIFVKLRRAQINTKRELKKYKQ